MCMSGDTRLQCYSVPQHSVKFAKGATSFLQVQVTRLVEAKMIEQPHRAAAYRRYQQTTAMWLPGVAALIKQ